MMIKREAGELPFPGFLVQIESFIMPAPVDAGFVFAWREVVFLKNPRYSNGALRRKYRARFKAMECPCGICKGGLGPIHYDEPSDARHPLSFVIDEIRPVSRWKEFGYNSPRAAAEDWSNLQPAHYCCNAAKGNRTESDRQDAKKIMFVRDGSW
nr:MAG TPA: HNH endonuclease [Caudoviricetes sp.]